MIRSELLAALAEENPDLRPEEVEQVVDIPGNILQPLHLGHVTRALGPGEGRF